jgi:hypothetical protein
MVAAAHPRDRQPMARHALSAVDAPRSRSAPEARCRGAVGAARRLKGQSLDHSPNANGDGRRQQRGDSGQDQYVSPSQPR